MSFVAVAIAGGAVVAAGATAYAASSASASASAAQAANANNIKNTNQLNYQMFQQSRGSTGSALLPVYATAAEKQLYNDTLSTYDATGAIQPTGAQLQAIVAQQQAAQNGANTAGANLFNGNLENQLLAAQAPVYQAQLQAAQTQKQGTLEALQQTLNNIKSIQAGKGYAGDSFGNNLLTFQAHQGANTNIANTFSQANISNAQAQQGIKSGVLSTQLSNLNIPGQLASNNVGLASLAGNQLATNQAQRNSLFAPFMIGNKGFTYQNLPTVNPVASTGQIAGQAVGTLAGGAGNYLATQQLIGQLNSQQPTTTSSSWNGGVAPNVGVNGNLTPEDYSAAANAASVSGDI